MMIVPRTGPNVYFPSPLAERLQIPEPGGTSPSNASRGAPSTLLAVNAVAAGLCEYVARFSGSVIVNVAPGANVRRSGNASYRPANRSAHLARTAFVTVTAMPPPVAAYRAPEPANVETVIGVSSGSCSVAPCSTRTGVPDGTTPAVSEQSVPDSTAMPPVVVLAA